MSFANILSKITQIGNIALGVEKVAAPYLSLIPGASDKVTAFDRIGTTVLNAIGHVEAINPVGGGQVKSDAVVADFESALEIAQAIADARGEMIVYDEPMLRSGIQDMVSGLNKIAQVKAGLKSVPKTKPAPAAPNTVIDTTINLPISSKS